MEYSASGSNPSRNHSLDVEDVVTPHPPAPSPMRRVVLKSKPILQIPSGIPRTTPQSAALTAPPLHPPPILLLVWWLWRFDLARIVSPPTSLPPFLSLLSPPLVPRSVFLPPPLSSHLLPPPFFPSSFSFPCPPLSPPSAGKRLVLRDRTALSRTSGDQCFFAVNRFAPIVLRLRTVVEVVPVVACAHPVVICGGIVSLVVSVGRRVVQLAGLRVLACGLGVEGSSGLAVKSLEHLMYTRAERGV